MIEKNILGVIKDDMNELVHRLNFHQEGYLRVFHWSEPENTLMIYFFLVTKQSLVQTLLFYQRVLY